MKTYKIITSLLQRLVWLPTRLAFKIFCRLEIVGIENINTENNVIFAANHISEIDPILIASAFPFSSRHLPLFYTCREKSFYKAKGGMKKVIYGGGFFKIWGAHQVYVGLRDYEQALVNHINILNNKCSVCIFPEGKKNAENKPLDIKGGVSFLSHKTNIPIIPVSITGAHFMTWRAFLSLKRKVKIIFGKPFFLKDIFSGQVILNSDQDDHKSISSIIMGKIKEL